MGGPSWNRSSINISETLSMQHSDVHRDSRVTIPHLLLRGTASTITAAGALTRVKEKKVSESQRKSGKGAHS